MPQRNMIRTASLLLLMCLTPGVASAFTGEARLGEITVTTYAPDWIWQDREINILLVARNSGPTSIPISVELKYPEGGAAGFSYKGDTLKTFEVAGVQTERQGFAGIVALEHTPDGQPVPLGRYEFRLQVTAGPERAEVRYPVTTIRGAVVSPGAMAIYLPVGLSLAWCLVFYLVFTRWQGRGAWRRFSRSAVDRVECPEWVEEVPSASKGKA